MPARQREVAAPPPPEFLPADAFDDLMGTRVWARPDPDTVKDVMEAIAPAPRRMPRATPPHIEPVEPPAREREHARRSASMMANLHEAAIRAPLARGEVRPARPSRPRRVEPALEVAPTIERPPPLDPRLLPPLPAAAPALRAAPVSRALPAAMPAPMPMPMQSPAPVPARASMQMHVPMRPAIFDHHDRRPSTAAAIEPPRFSRFSRPATRAGHVVHLAIAAAAIAAGVVIAAGYQIWAAQQPHGKQTALIADPPRPGETEEERVTRIALASQESQRVTHRTTAAYRDLWRSSVWYHPLTDEVFLPENKTRKFGARRSGERPTECGRGHCGVDIGFFGLPVRAAQDGVVEHVQRRSVDNAGRYVRIVHDSGFVSYYIHLHRIRKDLEVGMRVKGGDPIGIVGKTGIRRSRPHLHFQLAYRDGDQKFFIDPEPLLRRSVSAEDEASSEPDHHDDHAEGEHANLTRVDPAL